MKWHHAGILVRSIQNSSQFYHRVFGFSIEQSFTFQGESIVFLQKENVRIELIESDEQQMPFHSIHIAWQVEDIEKWIQKLKGAGVYPAEGPFQLKNGWATVFYEGPDHETIELIQVNSVSFKSKTLPKNR